MSNRLRELREEKGLTLKELVDDLKKVDLKISSDTLAKYERGDREPKLERWQKLADYFDVTVPYIQGVSDVKKDFSKERNPFEKWIKSIAAGTAENGDVIVDPKVWEKEMPSFGVNMTMQDFKNISSSIVTEAGFSINEIEKFEKELLPEINDVRDMNEISRITREIFEMCVLACIGDKKAKNYLATINNLISSYSGIDYFDGFEEDYSLRDPFGEE